MHHVEIGQEPKGLRRVRKLHTPNWVAHYQDPSTAKPTDDSWRRFRPELCRAFHGLCGYCERECKGEVDHLKPKSKFPSLTYEWSNWVFSCHDCNHAKGEKWPATGFLHPTQGPASGHPEQLLDFELLAGGVSARAGLPNELAERAEATIRDIGLGALHLRKARMHYLALMKLAIEQARRAKRSAAEIAAELRPFADRDKPLSSLVRALLTAEGLEGVI